MIDEEIKKALKTTMEYRFSEEEIRKALQKEFDPEYKTGIAIYKPLQVNQEIKKALQTYMR